MVFRP